MASHGRVISKPAPKPRLRHQLLRSVTPPPLPIDDRESFGQRLTRRRKERGFTQVELAEKVGLIQALISDYERDKLRPHADVIVRFAFALEVTADDLLGLGAPKKSQATGNRRFLRRLHQVDKLPKRDQDALLRTIDAFLAARKAG
jgi:transcriptional regulator with XRE-family HTH domain